MEEAELEWHFALRKFTGELLNPRDHRFYGESYEIYILCSLPISFMDILRTISVGWYNSWSQVIGIWGPSTCSELLIWVHWQVENSLQHHETIWELSWCYECPDVLCLIGVPSLSCSGCWLQIAHIWLISWGCSWLLWVQARKCMLLLPLTAPPTIIPTRWWPSAMTHWWRHNQAALPMGDSNCDTVYGIRLWSFLRVYFCLAFSLPSSISLTPLYISPEIITYMFKNIHLSLCLRGADLGWKKTWERDMLGAKTGGISGCSGLGRKGSCIETKLLPSSLSLLFPSLFLITSLVVWCSGWF